MVEELQANGDEVKGIFMQQEFCAEEVAIEKKLKRLVGKLGVPVTLFDTAPLVDLRDLSFPISQIPNVFTPFRKRVEDAQLGRLGREPLPMPKAFKPFPQLLPLSKTYGEQLDDREVDDLLPYLLSPLRASAETPHDPRSTFPYRGGETSALERLEFYFKLGSPLPVAKYKETRNGLLGHASSTKLSPFLCLGNISPRMVIDSLNEHERIHGATEHTYWVRFELLWRDYFLYIARKFGNALFKPGGFEEVTDRKQALVKAVPDWWRGWDREGSSDQPIVRWMEGRTGVPFIDANMVELRTTGFMSNRGRQNVASFLTKDLQVDWRIGAELFESQLIDYDPASNWGNWQYLAGVGNDPRASRQFNPIKQGHDYDPLGPFIKTWLPQLQRVSTPFIQSPWRLSPAERVRCITGPYPETPVVEPPHWKPHYTKRGPGKTLGNKSEVVRGRGAGAERGGNGGGGGPVATR